MWPKERWTFNEPDEKEARTAEGAQLQGARVALSGLCNRINPATASGSAQHLLLSFKAQVQVRSLCPSLPSLQLSVCIVPRLTCLAFRLASIESGHVNCFASSWLVSAERQREGERGREGGRERTISQSIYLSSRQFNGFVLFSDTQRQHEGPTKLQVRCLCFSQIEVVTIR